MNNSIIQRFVATYKFLFLFLLFGVGIICLFQFESFGIKPAVASLVTTIIGMILIGMHEQIIPFYKDHKAFDSGWLRDFKHLTITQGIMPKLITLATSYLIVRLSGIFPNLSVLSHLWPQNQSFLLQTIYVFLLVGLWRYWAHRVGHEIPTFWHFHAVHHSSTRLYWLNAGRWNPLDKAFVALSEIIPFVLLGINEHIVAIYVVIVSFNSFMQHANIDIRLGVFNYVINSTELHRWHHSKKIAESNSNYGNPLPIWEIVFKTFMYKKTELPTSIGIVPAFDSKGYLDDVIYPFRKILEIRRSK
jgi:sterol desaturase/sphingolipid hydroxylase (fatty acid hydroxylase superfamily)